MSANKLYLEDFAVGMTFEAGPVRLSEAQILAFAKEFDPQPFHLDEEAARRTHFGGLVASGWHTACLAMRIVVDGLLDDSTSMGSPGLEKLEWLRPVRPDDPLTLTVEVLEARPSRSKPDRGSVKFGYSLVNSAGETVFTQVAWVIFGRRTPGVT